MTPNYRRLLLLHRTVFVVTLLLSQQQRGAEAAFWGIQQAHRQYPQQQQQHRGSFVHSAAHPDDETGVSGSGSSSSTAIDGGGAGSSFPTTTTQRTMSLRERLKERIRQTAADGGIGTQQRPRASDGVYEITSEEQYSQLLQTHRDKLIVMKFTASYCKACMAMNPKFMTVKRNIIARYTKDDDARIVWADFRADKLNRAIFQRLGVLSLPTIHLYDTQGLEENFACGPTKIPIFEQKLNLFLDSRLSGSASSSSSVSHNNSNITATTRAGPDVVDATAAPMVGVPRKVRDIRIGEERITTEHISFLQTELPFFKDLTVSEFNELISKARLETFLPGDVIIRQGMPGESFFVIKSGMVEMLIKSRFDDPISTPPSYLGAVVKDLTPFDFFGERALTTGQPYAASVRVQKKTRCFVFDVDDIPASSILSRDREATQAMITRLTERYELPEDYSAPEYPRPSDDSILELLVRFKQIRQAAKCFDYVVNVAKPLLGDAGEIARRSILVSKLSHSQRQDFIEVFQLADAENTGTISLLEMRRFMESARKKVSDEELTSIIHKTNPGVDDVVAQGISLSEFLGVMAEAEFYNLFTETFQELDKDGTGYVRAGDLDEVLHGLRDLVGYDRKSLIDVEDQDVQVDYEQFAKMLLGAAL